MMVLSRCCCHRATLILWATTLAAVAATTPPSGEGGRQSDATSVGGGSKEGGGGGGGDGSGTPSPSVIQQLEKNLMSMFGIQQRPTIRRPTTVPPFMMELYHRQVGFLSKSFRQQQQLQQQQLQREEEGDEEEDLEPEEEPLIISSRSYRTNTIRSFIHKESAADASYPHHRMRFHFNVSNIPIEEVLHNADLRLTHTVHKMIPSPLGTSEPQKPKKGKPIRKKKWSTEDVPFLQRIMVYDILRKATKNTEPVLRLLDTKVIDARKGGVKKFDVYEALGRWITEPKKNFGLVVDVVPLNQTTEFDTSHVHLRKPAEDDSWHERQPLLVAYSNDPKATSRSKRAAPGKPKKTKNYCKRHPLYVDFRKVGWDDWIVAPAGYEAYFCKGDCPFPLSDEMNATNHAVVQTLVNSRYPDRVPKACCVPTELTAISMLYMDDDEKFVLKNHQDMVVEGCGCR